MKKLLTYCLKGLKWTLIGLAALVALVLVLLYLPPVQDFAVDKALGIINKPGGSMHIEVKKLRLRPPLRLTVDSLQMTTGGMEIAAASVEGRVEVLPLITGVINAPRLAVEGAVVNIGTPDSTLYMRANLGYASIDGASVGLSTGEVSVGLLKASRGKVDMVIQPDTVPKPEEPASAPLQWHIKIERAELDSIEYGMQLYPTIADLQCSLPQAVLENGVVDLERSTVDVSSLTINGVDATYLTPSAEYLAAHPVPKVPETPDTVPSEPWSICAAKLRVLSSHAIYATEGAVPAKNFDPAYIEASEINIEVDSFASRGSALTVPIKNISARERCGIALSFAGTFAMDSTAMYARKMTLTTPVTTINLDAMMGMDAKNPPLSAELSAKIGMDDVRRLVPAAVEPLVAGLPGYEPIEIGADIQGRMEKLEVRRLTAEIPRHIYLSAEGEITDYTDLNRAFGNLDIEGRITDGRFIKTSLLDAKLGRMVDIPPMRIEGTADIARGVMGGDLSVVTGQGDLALSAQWNNRTEGYDAEVEFTEFPVQSLLPTMGIGNLTATISARGEGLDFFSPKTHADASVRLGHVVYNGHTYRNVSLDAILADGKAQVDAASANPGANLSLKASGNLAGEPLMWDFAGDVKHLDLHALGLSDTVAEIAAALTGKASFVPAVAATRRTPGRPMQVEADVDLNDLYVHMGVDEIRGNDIALNFNTRDSLTTARVDNRSLALRFSSSAALDTILSRFTAVGGVLTRGLANRRLDIDSLQQALPQFDITLQSGRGNVLSSILADRGITVDTLSLAAMNDSLISARAQVLGIKSGSLVADTVTASLQQRGSYLLYDVVMDNRPGTFDQFAHVSAKGYLSGNYLSLIFKQQDIKDETGFSLGLMAQINDSSTVTLRFVPYHPIIGYKDWEINKDNFVSFNIPRKHIDANLYLHNSESSLHLFTNHNQGDSVQEDINLQLSDIKLQDWIALNPFAPPMTGNLSADMQVEWHMPDINGKGTVSLQDFYYDRRKVGDFDMRLDVATNAAGTIRANTSLMVNGKEAITASGNLNDSTAENPFMLDFRMIHFPLSVANPFLPADMAQLSGALNGRMDVVGRLSAPQFNGYLDFDTTTVNVTMLGTPFRFSDEKIPVENNVVHFSDFFINGVNDKPLSINGTVSLEDLTSPKLDLALRARNMQIVGSQKSRRSQAYGKAFIDLDATARGTLGFLDLDANLRLLPGTNVTYIIPDAVNAITSRSNQDMVKFVNFADTALVADADTVARPQSLMNINAQLTISTGTTVNVDLSADGNDKVQIISNGTLNYTQDYMNDQRFTGRLNLTGGYVRYNIPVMGEKSFDFNEGSYVAFNGDMMNPILNVDASDRIRSNVSVSGNNRVVNFDVGLKVTGTLEEMNMVFDLACPDDITIANELKSMTAEQRANQAMNLLISGIYRSGGTQTISSGNMGTNALFGFLESQLNTWASSAIKGVDISFGINQYDKTVDGSNTTAMNYSYQVSKSLFDDRFKIVVGGNYTTDAEADENFAQNLIADISFEYMLNKAGTMYVRLFRHTGYESILEGEITQTGVGFVYKKKIRRIADIFKFLRPKRRRPQPAAPAAPTHESIKESPLPVKKSNVNENVR